MYLVFTCIGGLLLAARNTEELHFSPGRWELILQTLSCTVSVSFKKSGFKQQVGSFSLTWFKVGSIARGVTHKMHIKHH